MRADPELRAVDDEANGEYMRDIAASLRRRDPRLRASRTEAIAAVLVKSMVGVVDAALEEPPARSRQMIEPLKLMHVAFLERCLRGALKGGS
jgi:hypothetical protein